VSLIRIEETGETEDTEEAEDGEDEYVFMGM